MTFSNEVLSLVRKIPEGKVSTYSEIAHALGKSCYRAIGKALQTNDDAPNTPCHRVIKSNGNIGGYFGEISGPKIDYKKHLLQNEGIKFDNKNNVVDFKKVLYTYE